jgi:hypothetical protein
MGNGGDVGSAYQHEAEAEAEAVAEAVSSMDAWISDPPTTIYLHATPNVFPEMKCRIRQYSSQEATLIAW